jgi:hypothetical protein
MGAKLQVFVNYFVNQTYYAEVLCKNKAVKNSCCKGKCAVEKELTDLAANEDQDPAGQTSVIKFSKVEEALCASINLSIRTRIISVIHTPYIVKSTRESTTDLLRPPLI